MKSANAPQAEAAWLYRKVLAHPLLEAFLTDRGAKGSVQVGWGLRPSGRAAIRAANGGQLLLLEDAFVNSLRPGGGTVYGLIADSKGMHYAPGGGSDLLELLDSGRPFGWMRAAVPAESDIDHLMMRFRETGASKYNWFPGEYRDEAIAENPGVLVVDQSRGDASIRFGGLSVSAFERMLREALDETSGMPVYVRAHPDHAYRKKRSCFPESLLNDARVKLLSPDLSPAQCFAFCRKVYVGSSLLGMEALLHGCEVVTYGQPFFAGRGLTIDRGNVSAPRALSARDLFAAAYLQYSHYFHPDNSEPCGLGDILDHIALQKEMFCRNRGKAVTVGFSPWKRQIVPLYLNSPAGSVKHSSTSHAQDRVQGSDRVLLWGRKDAAPAEWRARVTRVEDGFIRSKGLGAAFNFPYSWVLDDTGIYFDATQPSDLEHLLNGEFTSAETDAARSLIHLLREKRLTKYNLGRVPVSLDAARVGGRKVILVPGQVELDASIVFGSPEIKTNIDLLRRVRREEPEAFVIFKAHPDLVAGTRHGSTLPADLTEVCDQVVTDGNVLDWLDLCHEVHTMTSTVGFEALIRGIPVVTYGLPFYAGWGLTTDHITCPRRLKKRTVEELVAAALLKYPRYLNPETGEFTTAFRVIDILASGTSAGDRRAVHLKVVSALKKLWVESVRK